MVMVIAIYNGGGNALLSHIVLKNNMSHCFLFTASYYNFTLWELINKTKRNKHCANNEDT